MPDAISWTPLRSTSLKWLAPLLVCVLLAPVFWRTIRAGQPRDFVQEWASARNYQTGHAIYENQEISLQRHLGVRRQPNEFFLEYNAHPPTSVLLVLPFAWLDYPTAFLLWNLLSLLALVASIVLVFHELETPLSPQGFCLTLTAVMLASVCSPLREQLLQGQWNLLLLLLFTGTWAAARRELPWLAGSLLGLAIAIKLFPGFLLLFFLLRCQWRVVMSATLAFVGLTLLTLAFFGLETYRQYIVEVLPAIDAFRSAWPGISMRNFWCRLFDPSSACGVTIPLAVNPWLARILTLGSSMGVVGILAWVIYRARQPESFDRCYALSLVAMVLVSPIAWDHYLVFLLLPALLLWNQFQHEDNRLRWALIFTLLPLGLHRYFFWALLVCDPRLDWTHQVAQPLAGADGPGPSDLCPPRLVSSGRVDDPNPRQRLFLVTPVVLPDRGTKRMEASTRWIWIRRCSWMVFAVALFLFLTVGQPFVQRLLSGEQLRDFAQEWTSGRNYFTGFPIYEKQEKTFFYHLGHVRKPDEYILEYNAHPPTSVLLSLPFAALDYTTAFRLWTILSLAALCWTIYLLAPGVANTSGRLVGFPPSLH